MRSTPTWSACTASKPATSTASDSRAAIGSSENSISTSATAAQKKKVIAAITILREPRLAMVCLRTVNSDSAGLTHSPRGIAFA
jgi:hypothetical protein